MEWETLYDQGGDAHPGITINISLPMDYTGFHVRYSCDCGETTAFGGWNIAQLMKSVIADWNSHLTGRHGKW